MENFFTIISSLPISSRDFLTLVPICILVALLFHLSNKEIHKSLEQSKKVQQLLERDREELTEKLSSRTRELRETKAARLNELARAAEFGRLAQGLFHDLMTPLTSVILHTENLKNDRGTNQSIEKAVDASRRMAAYLKDIRATLAREETDREINLADELRTVIHLFSFPAKENGVRIVEKRVENIHYYGSPTKLRQIFSNLISNAIDAYELTNRKDKVIYVSLYKDIDIYYVTEDHGVGISEENIKNIFDPFFTTKPHDKGTGIGLTTVKSIVENSLHGKIVFESSPHRGTCCTISFPPLNTDPGAFPQHPQTSPLRG